MKNHEGIKQFGKSPAVHPISNRCLILETSEKGGFGAD